MSETQLICHVCGSSQVTIDEDDGLREPFSCGAPEGVDCSLPPRVSESAAEQPEPPRAAETLSDKTVGPQGVQNGSRVPVGLLLILVPILTVTGVAGVFLLDRGDGTPAEAPTIENRAFLNAHSIPGERPEGRQTMLTPSESSVLETEDKARLAITSDVTYAPGEAESERDAESTAEEKARDRAVLLASEYLRTALSPDEQSLLKEHCRIWAEGKLRVTDCAIQKGNDELRVILRADLELTGWQNYLSSKRADKPDSAAPADEFTVDFSFHRPNGDAIERGETMATGDRFTIVFSTTQACCVYVLNRGTSGAVNVLYPPSADSAARVPANTTVHLPGEDQDYLVQGAPGEEQIVLVASLVPVPEMERYIERLHDDNITKTDSDLLFADLRTRDIAVVKRTKTTPNMPDMAELEGQGTFVHEIRFQHR